jgi:DNA invertase Pin-like site-specific DNA recombinase
MELGNQIELTGKRSSLALQLDALKKAGCTPTFREKVSGAYRDRPELNRMLDQLRDGDVVTVWKLDRLARSTRRGMNKRCWTSR